jgi:hypothetical protein
MRTIQLSALALVLGVTTMACNGKSDSGTGITTTGGDDGSTGGDDATGDITSGTYGLYIESTCGIIWDMTGSATGDLAWSVSLAVNAATDCSGAADTTGSFEVASGSAYFDNGYVGTATYGGGAVAWATSGYVTGGGGGSYYYAGSAMY